MPTYDYKCPECNRIEEITHSIKDESPKSCSHCTTESKTVVMERLISKNTSGFIFKGGTETMAWREIRHRIKKNASLSLKQQERYGTGARLVPNVAGTPTENWSDAQKLAKEAGMNADSYRPLIDQEKNVSKISGVDDVAWKAAKEMKDKV